MKEKQADKILDETKVGFMLKANSAFITAILFSLEQEWDDSIPTAGTDGAFLKINPVWFSGLPLDERIGLLAHESWHVACMHMIRGKNYSPAKYNKAADYFINLMLRDNGYSIPPNGCIDKKYRNMCTEEIYNLLDDCEVPQDYDLDIISAGDDRDDDTNQHMIENILVRASIISQQQKDSIGTIPGEIERHLDELLNPKLSWETILNNILVISVGHDDFTWTKPNRRFMPDFYLPSSIGQSVGTLVFGVDASASVSQQEFTAYLTEINEIKNRYNPKEIIVIDFDTSIKEIRTLSPQDRIEDIKLYGGGGTSIIPIMRWIEKNEPEIVIIFTDGDFHKYEPVIESDLIWVINNNPGFTSAIGTIVHFEA